MKFSIKDLFSKCDQILSFMRIWSHLLKKSLMENFIFCLVILKVYLYLLRKGSLEKTLQVSIADNVSKTFFGLNDNIISFHRDS